MPLLSTVVIERNLDPNNIIMPTKQPAATSRKRRLLVYISRIGHEKFDESEGSPLAKGFWVKGVSKDDWEFIRDRDYVWVLETTPDLEKEGDIYQWFNRWLAHRHEIANRMLEKLGLDNKKYEVYGYDKTCFQSIPGLYEIKK